MWEIVGIGGKSLSGSREACHSFAPFEDETSFKLFSSNLETEINGGIIIESLVNSNYTKKPNALMDLFI